MRGGFPLPRKQRPKCFPSLWGHTSGRPPHAVNPVPYDSSLTGSTESREIHSMHNQQDFQLFHFLASGIANVVQID